MKRFFKILSVVIASLLMLILVATLFLTHSPGENVIKGWLENQLAAQIGLPVSIDKFETNLWSRVQIDTLIIGSSPGREQRPLLYVGQIRVGYSIPQLLGETITVKELAIDSVSLGIELDSLGRYGIPLLDAPTTATSDSPRKSGSVCIDTLSLNRVNLSYFDQKLSLSIDLAGAVMSAQGTPDGAFSGRMKADYISALYDSLSLIISNFEIGAALDSEAFHIEYVQADCQGLQLNALGDIDLTESKNVNLTISVNGTLDTLASAMVSAFDLPSLKAGPLNALCRIDGSMDDPRVELEAGLRDLVIDKVRLPSAMLTAQYQSDFLLIDTFQISALDGIIEGNAGLSLDSLGASSINIVLDKIAIAPVWQAIYSATSPYDGILSGRISTEGEGRDVTAWAFDAAVTGKNLVYLNRSVPDLTCRVKSQAGHSNLSLIHGADEVQADIEFSEDSLKGRFNVAVPDITALSRFIDQPDLSGGLWAHGTINGAYSNPAFRTTVNGSRIIYRNFPVDSIFAELSYEDSSITIIDLTCEGGLESIDTLHPPFDIDSLTGSIWYRCQLQGPLEHLSGDIQALMLAPQYGSYAIDSISIKAILNGSQLTVTDLGASRGELGARLRATYDTSSASGSFDLLLRPGPVLPDSLGGPAHDGVKTRDNFGTIGGEFTLGPDSDLSASVHGQELWLGLLSLLMGDTILTDGELGFDLSVDGPSRTPAVVFDATARSVLIADYLIDSISTSMRITPEELLLDSLISYALGHRLQAAGRLELGISPEGRLEVGESASVAVELGTNDFDLSVLAGLISPGSEISGTASTSLRVTGTVAAPRFNGWLMIENGSVLIEEGSLPAEDIGLFLSFADSVLTVDSASGTVAEMIVDASGSLTTSDFKSVAVGLAITVGQLGKLAAQGIVSDTAVHLQLLSDSLDMAVFQPFITTVDSLAGRLSCLMEIHGAPTSPQIEGFLRIDALSFAMPQKYIRLSDGRAAISFDKSRVIIDSASASLNGGRLAVSGAIEHTQGELSDLALALQANKITLQEPGTYTVAVDSATLSYGKRQENYILDGDIVLGEARFTAGLRPTSILPWVRSIETVDLELPDLIARSRLDVRVRESNNLWVDNNLARIRLRAELGIIGTSLRPNFTGLVRIEEGYLLYLDRRFRVNEGTVYFNDPTRFNPDIILDASTQVTAYKRTVAEPYTVFIKAEGLLDQLQYGLYSEPPLEKSDIVSLLTLGATRTELAGGDGNSGLTGVLTDRAAMLASDKVSGFVSRKAGSLFGFDEFTIQGNLFKFDETWGPQLVASKRLTKRVDFTYSTTVGHLNDQTVRLGYRLTPRFSLQGETDRQGRSGLDLKCGFTFK